MYEVSVVHHISYGPLMLDNQKVDEIHSVLLEKCKCVNVLLFFKIKVTISEYFVICK